MVPALYQNLVEPTSLVPQIHDGKMVIRWTLGPLGWTPAIIFFLFLVFPVIIFYNETLKFRRKWRKTGNHMQSVYVLATTLFSLFFFWKASHGIALKGKRTQKYGDLLSKISQYTPTSWPLVYLTDLCTDLAINLKGRNSVWGNKTRKSTEMLWIF